MKIFVVLVSVFLASASAFALSYNLKMDLSLNGKHVSSPHVVVKAGETATVTQVYKGGKTFVDVVATQQEDHMVMMKFVVGTIAADGTKTVLSTPKVLTVEDEEAQIQSQSIDKDDVSLAVVATAVR